MTTESGAILTGTTSAVIVGTGVMPLWLIVTIGIIGGAIALVNQDELNYKTIPTYIMGGAFMSASGTNLILVKFFEGSEIASQIGIGVAFILGIFGHIVIHFMLENKKKIKDKLSKKIFDNDDKQG